MIPCLNKALCLPISSYLARDMFGKSTIVLGSETNEKLFSALVSVLASYGSEAKESKYYVVGSQEITEYVALIGAQKLKIVSETYEGLSINGSTKLINEIKAKVMEHVAI
jgi:hypothetical protein